MGLFCECSKEWRRITDEKLDLILRAVSSSTHLSPEDRAAIEAATAKLKSSTDAMNAAIVANQPPKS